MIRKQQIAIALIGTMLVLTGCGNSGDKSATTTNATTAEITTEATTEAITEATTEAKDTASSKIANLAVQESYQTVIDLVTEKNVGKKFGDDFIEKDIGYLTISLGLTQFKKDIKEKGLKISGIPAQSELWFGERVETIEDFSALISNTQAYMAEYEGDYLSPFAKKLSTLDSVSGTITPKKIDIQVDAMDEFLKEIKLSALTLGRILPMLEIYAIEVDFTETGFSFQWDSGDDYKLNLK